MTQTAHLLTGWTVNPQPVGRLGSSRHCTNRALKTILGKRYAEGPQALDQLLDDLSSHPACAIFVATKLARHFVTDDPPAALVESVARRFRDSSGDLMA
ncbi:MAG: DUF1800 family protein, partial [Betaproteobacteria bacterium]|nr:DUF1800 family protein [Betaproteobacteria bacterium]